MRVGAITRRLIRKQCQQVNENTKQDVNQNHINDYGGWMKRRRIMAVMWC